MREMNLLPEEHLYKLEQKRIRKKHMLRISFIVLAIIISYLSVYFMEYNVRKEIVSIKDQIENLRKVSNTQIEISINQEVLDHRSHMLEMVENKRMDHYQFISQLEETIPNEITIENLTYTSNQHLNIKGRTTKADVVADFMANVAKIEGVENVLLDFMHFEHSEDQQGNASDFNINFTYQPKKGGLNNDLKQ